ncbi:MAG: FAD:protein FMN transferase [Oscillospiraceae bacterium]|nr:FAD:protein FMN transferase [Oscillospiraceae bacterium]
MKKLLSMLIILILVFTFSSCADGKKRYEAESLQVFDTVTKIIAYSKNKSEFTELSEFVFDILNEYHKLYDIYHDYHGINNIKTINDNAGKSPVKVDKKIIDLLLFSKNAYTKTRGKCNVALGSVLKIWHKYRESGIDDPQNAKLPDLGSLRKAASHTDIGKIIIDEKKSTVFLADPKMSLDVGAVAKGFAAECVAQEIALRGYTSVLISIGGNVIAIGAKPGGSFWNVGIENPDNDGKEMPTLQLKDKSVVTSGVYQRYYTVNGKQYHHIIDPEALMPSTYFKSVTVVSDDSGLADALSTAVMCMPYEQGKELIDSISGTDAVWVLPDSNILYSDNFKQYLKK